MSSLNPKCLLIGHDDSVHMRAGRMFLHCVECGRETSGWDLATSSKHQAATASPEHPPHGLRHFFAQMLRLLPFPTRP